MASRKDAYNEAIKKMQELNDEEKNGNVNFEHIKNQYCYRLTTSAGDIDFKYRVSGECPYCGSDCHFCVGYDEADCISQIRCENECGYETIASYSYGNCFALHRFALHVIDQLIERGILSNNSVGMCKDCESYYESGYCSFKKVFVKWHFKKRCFTKKQQKGE